MNKNILDKSVQDYISQNLSTDVFEIILKKQIFPKVTNKEIAEQISAKIKSKKKVNVCWKLTKVTPKSPSYTQSDPKVCRVTPKGKDQPENH